MKRIYFNDKGGSLVSVLVAIGLLSVASFQAIQLIINQNKISQSLKDKQVFVNSLEEARLSLANSSGCSLVFNSGSPLTIAPSSSVDLTQLDFGSQILRTGVTGNLTISSIKLYDLLTLPTPTYDSVGTPRNHHRFRLEFVGSVDLSSRVKNFNKSFLFDALVDGSNQIVECVRGQNSEKVACEAITGPSNATVGYRSSPKGCVNKLANFTCSTPNSCVYGFDSQNVPLCHADN